MSYKIVNSTQQIHAINAAYANYEAGAFYCKLNANANQTQWAIAIMPVLNNLGLDFINHQWLTTDIVETLPPDWYWHLPEKPIRIILDNSKLPSEMLATTPFFQLIMELIGSHKEQSFPEGNETFIYVAYIDEQYESLINDAVQRGIIQIETLNT